MTYVLLMVVPVVMAMVCFGLRQQQTFVLLLATATCMLLSWMLWVVPPDQPSLLMGVSVILRPINKLFLITFCLGLAATFIVAIRVAHGENFVTIGLLLLGLLIITLLIDVQAPFLITLLLLTTGLVIVIALVDLPLSSPVLLRGRAIASGLRYLVLMLLAGILLALCFVLADLENASTQVSEVSFTRPLLALLIVGIGLRLATIPFHAWLPDLLEDAPPLVGVLIALVNIGALLFFVSALQFLFAPGLLDTETASLQRLLRIFVLISAVGGALLAIHERASLRRFLGMLLIYDMGSMLFGVVSSTTGLTGALFQAFNEVLIAVVVWTALALLERPEPTRPLEGDGFLRRRPWASAAFIGGVLALLGMPPFNGFASRMLLYQGAAEQGWGYLATLLLATAIAAYAFALVLRDHFLGRAPDVIPEADLTDFRGLGLPPPPPQRLEPLLPTSFAVSMLGICVLIGLYPPPILDPIVEAVRGLTFVQFF